MKRLLLLVTLFALLALPIVALADHHVTVVHEYDPLQGQFPEGIAIDKRGTIYMTLAALSQIRRITPDRSESLFYEFASPAPFLTGLAVDASGNLYACAVAVPGAESQQGVWRFSPDGQVEQLSGSNNITWANGLAFDQRGNLYVTSSYAGDSAAPLGAIWRIPPGGVAEPWFVDAEFLGGLGQIPDYPPLGANGISFYHNNLYVANTEKGLIARIPVLPDGSPGEPSIVAQEGFELYLIDGLALDVHGTIYAALVGQDRIVAVDPDTGDINEIAGPADDVDGPSSLAFGTGKGQRKSLFFVNYAFPFEPDSHPGLLKLHVGVPGLPLP